MSIDNASFVIHYSICKIEIKKDIFGLKSECYNRKIEKTMLHFDCLDK